MGPPISQAPRTAVDGCRWGVCAKLVWVTVSPVVEIRASIGLSRQSLTSACTNSATRVHALTVETPLLPLAKMRFTTSCITWRREFEDARPVVVVSCEQVNTLGITAGKQPYAEKVGLSFILHLWSRVIPHFHC